MIQIPQPFIDDALANPGSDDARLILADFLDDAGKSELATFIRLSVRISRYLLTSGGDLPAWQKQIKEILDKNAMDWLANLPSDFLDLYPLIRGWIVQKKIEEQQTRRRSPDLR